MVTTKIPLDHNFPRLFRSNKWKQMQDEVGTFDFCHGCRNLCYLHPSFNYRYDRLFVLSALSDYRYLRERKRIEAERKETLATIAAAEDDDQAAVPTPLPIAVGR
jgi:hypothetical protein